MPGACPQSPRGPEQALCWVLLGAEHPVPGGMQPGSAVQERRPCGWLPEGASCCLKTHLQIAFWQAPGQPPPRKLWPGEKTGAGRSRRRLLLLLLSLLSPLCEFCASAAWCPGRSSHPAAAGGAEEALR